MNSENKVENEDTGLQLREEALVEVAGLTQRMDELKDLVQMVPLGSYFDTYIQKERSRNRIRTWVLVIAFSSIIAMGIAFEYFSRKDLVSLAEKNYEAQMTLQMEMGKTFDEAVKIINTARPDVAALEETAPFTALEDIKIPSPDFSLAPPFGEQETRLILSSLARHDTVFPIIGKSKELPSAPQPGKPAEAVQLVQTGAANTGPESQPSVTLPPEQKTLLLPSPKTDKGVKTHKEILGQLDILESMLDQIDAVLLNQKSSSSQNE